jgi:hypothetical protein
MKHLKTLFLTAFLGTPATMLGADYYVDPSLGSMAFEGSEQKPWKTLEEVFAARKTFAPGDRIFLRRGYHGGVSIQGVNTGMVSILAQEGHTPVLKWLRLINAQKWHVQDVVINPDVAERDGVSSLIEFLQNSHDNEIYHVWAGSTARPWGWESDQKMWLLLQKTGVSVTSGVRNRIHGVHVMNVGNAVVIGTPNNVFEYSTVENFSRDGLVANGNNTVWQYNTVLNAIIADENGPSNPVHRDMFQTWNGAKTAMVIRGNTFVTSTDITKTFIDKRIPVLALWDGPFSGYLIENNVVFTDNGAGIWMNAGSYSTIVNNTCTRISSASDRSWPLIKIGQKTSSSKKSFNNTVYNNIADGFDFKNMDGSSSVSNESSNIVVRRNGYVSSFLYQGAPKRDVHLSLNASHLKDKGFSFSNAEFLDADMQTRSNGTPDVGAYEWGGLVLVDNTPPTAPSGLQVYCVPQVGCDVHWNASQDNRWVVGYDVYRNGVRVARTRAGTRFFDVKPPLGAVSYGIKAFDSSSNTSFLSAQVSSLF